MSVRVGVSFKLVFLVLTSVFLSGVFALGASFYSVRAGLEKEFKDSMLTFQRVVEDKIQAVQQNYKKLAKSQSVRPNVLKGVSEKDHALLKKLGKDLIDAGQTEFIVFTDESGKVLARGHDDKYGDSIAEQECVRKALGGVNCVTFEPGKVVRVSLRASAPVTQDGKVVGAVVVGMNISTGDSFVDSVKSLLEVETTLFFGNVRESTTLITDGKRAIGTTIEDKIILDKVLARGEVADKKISLFNVEHLAVYWPIKSSEGKPVGMLFIGKSTKDIRESEWNVFKNILFAVIAAMLLLGVVGLFASRKFTNPILSLLAFSQAVAKGDFKRSIGRMPNDEMGDLGQALVSMVDALKTKISESDLKSREAAVEAEKARVAGDEARKAMARAESAKSEGLLHAADMLDGVVTIVSQASTDLSGQITQAGRGSELQAQRVGETATAMAEMNATVVEVAQNASLAAETADHAKEQAMKGSQIVERVVQGISDVNSQSHEMKAAMTELGAMAHGIGRILNVISDIADQTNLLALNAAIEAARAGEAGRGFAVVADEVRKLAEKTMTATKEVDDAIRGIQSGTAKSIANVEQTAGTIEDATRLAAESGEALKIIVSMVEQASDQVRSIATASEEQSAASEEISRAIEEINRICTDTADAMHQSTRAVSKLVDQSQVLSRLMNDLKEEGHR